MKNHLDEMKLTKSLVPVLQFHKISLLWTRAASVLSLTEIINPGSSKCRYAGHRSCSIHWREASRCGSPVAIHLRCNRLDLHLNHQTQQGEVQKKNPNYLRVICDYDQVQWGMNHKVPRLKCQRKTPRLHRSTARHRRRSTKMKRIR